MREKWGGVRKRVEKEQGEEEGRKKNSISSTVT